MTSSWARWRLKSPASPLFTQSFIQAQMKENIKAPRHWPLCGEFTADPWIPAQMASNAENVSIWWRHHADYNRHLLLTEAFTEISPWFTGLPLRNTITIPIKQLNTRSTARFRGPFEWRHIVKRWLEITDSQTNSIDNIPDSPVGPRWAPCWPHELCYLGCVSL